MMGSGSGSGPDTQPQHGTVFTKGQEVEVTCDEEGFRGAWYSCTILEPGTATPTSKRRKKALVQYKSLLHNNERGLLKEHVDPCNIRPPYPSDMSVDGVFEVDDVVEADYLDGWWIGVIRKVLEGPRYRVYFDSPPDVIDIDAKQLRLHLKWIDGNWVRPGKSQKMVGSDFSSGMDVEVSLEEADVLDTWYRAVVVKENGDGTFLVKYETSENYFQHEKSSVDCAHIRAIPPYYPEREYQLLEKVDACGEHDVICWQAGVITKLLTGRKYNVFFKKSNSDRELDWSRIRPHAEWIDGKWLCNSKEVVMVSDSQGQPNSCNLEMVVKPESSGAANKSSKRKSSSIRSVMGQQSDSDEKSAVGSLLHSTTKQKVINPNGKVMHACTSEMLAGDAIADQLSTMTLKLYNVPIETPINETLHSLTTPKLAGKRSRGSTKSLYHYRRGAKTQNLSSSSTIMAKQLKVVEKDLQKMDKATKHCRSDDPSFKTQASIAGEESKGIDASANEIKSDSGTKGIIVPLILGLEAKVWKGISLSQLINRASLKRIRDQKNNLDDSTTGRSSMDSELNKFVGNSQRRKRGRPLKYVDQKSSPEAAMENNATGCNEVAVKNRISNEVELLAQTGLGSKASQNASRKKISRASDAYITTDKVDKAAAKAPKNVADDDQPLSTWFGGHSLTGLLCARPTNGLNEAREKEPVTLESDAIDVRDNDILDANQCLPFVKKSQVWQTVESIDVFQLVPQKPHFRPLTECKEEFREGTAIGIMVSFASLFEKISSMQFDDSRSTYESTLESLHELEKHGFDVTLLQQRVNDLLSIRDGQAELLNVTRDAEKQMTNLTEEKRDCDEKVCIIEKKIAELLEELDLCKTNVEAKNLEISTLQVRINAVNEQINNARQEYEKVATAPWKLP